MVEITNQELVEIGKSAAVSISDLGKVEAVAVAGGQDSLHEFTYVFSFLLDPEHGRDRSLSGPAYTRLAQALRDDLMDRGHNPYPAIRLFTKEDWAARTGA